MPVSGKKQTALATEFLFLGVTALRSNATRSSVVTAKQSGWSKTVWTSRSKWDSFPAVTALGPTFSRCMVKSDAHLSKSAKVSANKGLTASFLMLLVDAYRYALSPLLSGGCRFEPSCSHYAQDALRKYGAWRGSIIAAKRLLRCHPWHEAGFDPVE